MEPKSTAERIYKKEIYDQQYVLIHPNNIALIGITEEHPIIKESLEINSISFEVDGINRLKNNVKGIKKKGGQFFQVNDTICELKCSNQKTYKIISPIKGKLIEINELIISNHNLIKQDNYDTGFISIVQKTMEISTKRRRKNKKNQKQTKN
ncbi:hypothetical protein M0812_11950 [Anaeramoeba flamelloides]|uniref:Protein Abitram n=1 Tax=Anaeramoeba flamelloides TaxID=1746091 RepID=A0AAV7ZLZ6_9EUKA|nr:hypothetical protein M0812_11950 [Anaeramoeba flamelloides]